MRFFLRESSEIPSASLWSVSVFTSKKAGPAAPTPPRVFNTFQESVTGVIFELLRSKGMPDIDHKFVYCYISIYYDMYAFSICSNHSLLVHLSHS